MQTLNDKDLFEPIIKQSYRGHIDKETLEVISAYSQLANKNNAISDAKKIIKSDNLKQVRKSEGYRKFINKFKK